MTVAELKSRLIAAEQHIKVLQLIVDGLLSLSTKRTQRVIFTAVYAALHSDQVARRPILKGGLVQVYQQLHAQLQKRSSKSRGRRGGRF